ncbi:tRNA 2-selenouridine(34) synthase MnmH [Candidatus Uabimicrobium amorphum]|uniref:tRNA 2-selenouridine(34) synthase MnmH n=1 Tax=Uabimicrobium amorphum TaxID=2596890 RepID=A0A5S9F2V5_UABAM|nr:tRNA 2-selenouridine(34) synthase MnmH [Candidatus Uabimicrobium amorphum]BBM83852.1 tRNA 2-selenouridine(34) synthase MnmH [Candidatus Uabimicrobium amorphum]
MKHIDISQALNNQIPIVDVRSEGEFAKGHIPQAHNIPLMNNEERKLVGIEYRKQGSQSALNLGYKLVGPKFAKIKKKLKDISHDNKLAIHCWRGGKRSEISCQLAEEMQLEVQCIQGGYRSYRRWCRETTQKQRKFYVLSGATGSGKTQLLYLLEQQGLQVLDLEKLAHHKGSVFGGLGNPPQPLQEMFENRLAQKLNTFKNEPIFVENESRMIGKLFIPECIFTQLKSHNVLYIELPREIRQKRIRKEYAHFAKQDIYACAQKLQKRLGGLRLQNIKRSLELGNYDWIDILLDYYDRSYAHHKQKYNQRIVNKFCGDSPRQIYGKIINWLPQIAHS